MKGIDLITQLTADQKKLLINSALQYKRFAKIYMEVLEVNDGIILAKVQQKENESGQYLNADELKERVRIAFTDCTPDGFIVKARAIPFRGDLNMVDTEYIREKQLELGLKDGDLSRLLNIRKENLSRLVNDKRGLTKWHQAAFFYLFKSLENK